MKAHFKQLDRLLRGEATSTSALQFGGVMISTDKILLASILLAAFTGLCMGTFAAVNGNDAILQRLVATMLKVPVLFFLTLFVTFPSLYAFNAILGSRLDASSLLRLLVSAIGVMVAVLASLGPIIAFFSVSATSYSFILLLNVVVFAVAGLLGFRFLHRTFERITLEGQEKASTREKPEEETDMQRLEHLLNPSTPQPGPLDRTSDDPAPPKAKLMFRIWIVVFGLVGAQTSWVLRPWIGKPNTPFQWIGERESNFFEGVLNAFVQLLFG